MVKAAVILSGCGYLDGAEIRESVLTLLYLDQQGAQVSIFAPDIDQMHVVDHAKGEPTSETRNCLTEAARIARGQVQPLCELQVDDFDTLLIPGGFGVAKNLSDLAVKGTDCAVNEEFQSVILAFLAQEKPIGAICIAPAVLAAAIQGSEFSPTLTIGDDADTAGAIHAFGSIHQDCDTANFIYDEATKIASCSAYMREGSLSDVAKGIEKTVHKVISVAQDKSNKAA